MPFGVSGRGVQWLATRIVPVHDTVPDVFGGLSKPEQTAIVGIDDTFIDEKLYVDRPTGCRSCQPIRFMPRPIHNLCRHW